MAHSAPGVHAAMLAVFPEYGPYIALRKDGIPCDEAFTAARAIVELWREQDDEENDDAC